MDTGTYDFRLTVTTMALANGRRSFYAAISIGDRRWFLSRWDTPRVLVTAGQFDIWRGRDMTWYVGTSW